jgi:hypothetical protein
MKALFIGLALFLASCLFDNENPDMLWIVDCRNAPGDTVIDSLGNLIITPRCKPPDSGWVPIR